MSMSVLVWGSSCWTCIVIVMWRWHSCLHVYLYQHVRVRACFRVASCIFRLYSAYSRFGWDTIQVYSRWWLFPFLGSAYIAVRMFLLCASDAERLPFMASVTGAWRNVGRMWLRQTSGLPSWWWYDLLVLTPSPFIVGPLGRSACLLELRSLDVGVCRCDEFH